VNPSPSKTPRNINLNYQTTKPSRLTQFHLFRLCETMTQQLMSPQNSSANCAKIEPKNQLKILTQLFPDNLHTHTNSPNPKTANAEQLFSRC